MFILLKWLTWNVELLPFNVLSIYVSEYNTMEYDTYYYLTHPPYLTYEDMLRDAERWDDSIKERYNQQPSSIKEEEEEPQII